MMDLPEELWRQVLARLPVKTLLILKCVNKRLRSIIDDPYLLSMHLKQYNNGRHYDNTKLLSLHTKRGDKDGWFLKGSTISLRRWDTLTETSRLVESSDKVWSLTGSCLGLVLMLDHYPRRQLRLWNPSIRKSIVLPSCPFKSSKMLHVVYALGFSPSTLSFKVAAFQIDVGEDSRDKAIVMPVAVYTVGDDIDTQHWRIITNDSGVANIPVKGPKASSKHKGFLYFEGAVYWTISNRVNNSDIDLNSFDFDSYKFNDSDTHLIWFDFDSEKFSWVKLPEEDDESSDAVKFVLIMEEKLAIMSVSQFAHYIWFMKKDDSSGGVSWTLHLCDGSTLTQYYKIKNHRCLDPEIFHLDDGGTTFIFRNYSYDIDIPDKITRLLELPYAPHTFKLHTYLESLALCKQGQPFP